MAWFCGRALRCCLGRHWWITFWSDDGAHWQSCGRKGCSSERIVLDR